MTGEWNKISELFEHVLSLPRAAQNDYLAELARTESPAVVTEVKALLQADEDSAGFMQTNALRLAARELANGDTPIRTDALYGNYRILKKLGAGGMGEVYLAQDESLGRQAALKFLPQVFMQDAEQRARFEREARAASALNHPNILTVYEIGEAHGRVFIATEYVAGQTLREKIKAAALTPHDIFSIAEQVGEALHAAHSAGLIHRDIKPENIMLRPDGYVKLLDFGLAKPTAAQNGSVSNNLQSAISNLQSTLTGVWGTPKYMSPEQARGETLDRRSDLWSLGVTLYEMLTRHTPYQSLQALREEQPINWQPVPAAFQPIVQKALAAPVASRYQDADELLADLRQTKQVSPQRHSPRRFWMFAAALLLAVFAGWLWWRATPRTIERLYWELSTAEQQVFVSEATLRVAQTLGDGATAHTPAQVELIRKHIAGYVARRNSLATEPGRESLKAVYARATVYAPFIIEAFRAYRLPPVAGLYVAMNETEYHPCSESLAGGKGLFSFMPQTAERYGLRLAPQDERCDPRGIANAAARYLNDLAQLFGRDANGMTLALVAYNCGEHCIAERINKLKERHAQPLNFWSLLALSELPLGRESSEYIPRFFAEAVIGENPQRFGLEIQPLSVYTTAK